MWNRKQIKRKGKQAFKRSLWKSIAVCLIVTVLVGGTTISVIKDGFAAADVEVNYNINQFHAKTNSDIVNEFLEQGSIEKEPEPFLKATSGILANVTNNVTQSGSFLFGLLNALNQMLFKDRIFAGIIIILGAFFTFLYWFFVSFVLQVGRSRFFLENRKYGKTKPGKIILPYRVKKTWHISVVMLQRKIYTFLWSLTLIGGLIKHYSYLMIPYILAENPTVSSKDAFLLSRKMMHGYKWKCFCLDFSYIWWYVLGGITLNVSNLLYLTPYIECTYAEVYMFLREKNKQKNEKAQKYLCDNYLEGEYVLDEYPEEKYMLKEHESRKWMHIDYHKEYTIPNLILLFFFFSFCGWIWEVLLHLFQTGEFVNRGTLFGPWLPIYGSGGILILVLLKKYREKPFVTFVLAMLICTVVEYATACYLEIVHHMKWWDYTGYLLNIDGKVCLEATLFFGLGGCAFTYIFAPLAVSKIEKINIKWQKTIGIVLILLIFADFRISSRHPNIGEGITSPIQKQEEIQEKLVDGL